MAKFNINNQEFKSQKDAQQYAKGVLYKYPIGHKFTDGNDFDFMMNYFQTFHHEWQYKKSVGILSIEIVKEPNYGKYNAFRINRVDGTSTDISYIISNIKKRNIEGEFRRALRQVIEPQIKEFRQLAFSDVDCLICPVSKKKVTFYKCHIDHYEPTFEQIVNNFIKDFGLDSDKISKMLSNPNDNQTMPKITDSFYTNAFYYYHFQNAKLRVLSINANLSRKKR